MVPVIFPMAPLLLVAGVGGGVVVGDGSAGGAADVNEFIRIPESCKDRQGIHITSYKSKMYLQGGVGAVPKSSLKGLLDV